MSPRCPCKLMRPRAGARPVYKPALHVGWELAGRRNSERFGGRQILVIVETANHFGEAPAALLPHLRGEVVAHQDIVEPVRPVLAQPDVGELILGSRIGVAEILHLAVVAADAVEQSVDLGALFILMLASEGA